MPTYLLAFVVSDFKYTTNIDRIATGETIHRVYAREDAYEKTEYALENSFKFLNKLEEFAMYTYELKKMYSAAIPDFAAGKTQVVI